MLASVEKIARSLRRRKDRVLPRKFLSSFSFEKERSQFATVSGTGACKSYKHHCKSRNVYRNQLAADEQLRMVANSCCEWKHEQNNWHDNKEDVIHTESVIKQWVARYSMAETSRLQLLFGPLLVLYPESASPEVRRVTTGLGLVWRFMLMAQYVLLMVQMSFSDFR